LCKQEFCVQHGKQTLTNSNKSLALKKINRHFHALCLRQTMSLYRDHNFDQSKVRIDLRVCTVEWRLWLVATTRLQH